MASDISNADVEQIEQAKRSPSVTDCVLAIKHCQEAKLEPFCDELGTPGVLIPDDPIERVWAIQSGRVKSWIAATFHATTDRTIADRDISQVLRVLEGQAWKKPRRIPRDEATWNVMERNPVALAIIIYANQNGDLDGLTRDLFKSVSHPSIQARLIALASKFPVNTQVFSRRVKDVIPLLKTIGLEITLRRDEAGSQCTLKMQRPTFVQEPDGICVSPSAVGGVRKMPQAGNVGAGDGTDAINPKQENWEPHMAEFVLGEIKAIREGSLCPND